MKNRIIVLFLLITSSFIAQPFITEPEFPTENDRIEITFNINEMTNTSLLGYTGTLYTHTGVNTNLYTWGYVIESWGNNTYSTFINTDWYRPI